MNAIIGLTELVLETDLTTTQRGYLSTVLESGESLMSIINQILDFSKIEAGKIDLESVAFNLREEVGDTMKSLGMRAHRKQLELAWHADANVPAYVVGDPSRLRQVLVNLTGNAIKFTKSGEVVLNVACESSEPGNVELHFSISDTGVGISNEKLESIFSKFEQADTSTTREFGGTGLGLSISSSLVGLMGGQIWVESELGKGSTFHFTIPLPVAEEPASATRPPSPEKLDGMRALLIDDNATNRLILDEVLKGWGILSMTAESGHRAIEIMLRQCKEDKPIDLVLTDINMPEMDGFQLAEQIREEKQIAQTPIIALTSGDRIGDPAHVERLGIHAELMKPVKQSELLETILEVIAPGNVELGTAEKPGVSDATPQTPALNVLLAEDGLANQKLAVGLLNMWGHQVTVAKNGRIAVDLWREGNFDLILMDLQMPELDGIEATKLIRRLEKETGGHIPIIAMTAHAVKGFREKCLDSGMDSYISKPVRKQQLYDELEPFFGRLESDQPE
jgi:two-component system sensor histidine kinase/response regulator